MSVALGRRPRLLLLAAGAAALLGLAALTPAGQHLLVRFQARSWTSLALLFHGLVWQSVVQEFFLNPWFYAVFVLVLLLERVMPAAQPGGFHRGMRQDLWWVTVELTFRAALLPFYIVLLRGLYDRHLSFLTLHAVAAWPGPVRLAAALLASDLVSWATHVVRHKATLLWQFHAVHHSQRELNFFSEYRLHPVDATVHWTLGFVPLFMVDGSFTTVLALVWIRHWHSRIVHSNLRTNFGPLRYVLVTPQSHRIHHSRERRHFDTNYGLTFSIWDHLFGTQYRVYDEYPETGIPEEAFPVEQEAGARSGPRVLLDQLLYPFRALSRRSLTR